MYYSSNGFLALGSNQSAIITTKSCELSYNLLCFDERDQINSRLLVASGDL